MVSFISTLCVPLIGHCGLSVGIGVGGGLSSFDFGTNYSWLKGVPVYQTYLKANIGKPGECRLSVDYASKSRSYLGVTGNPFYREPEIQENINQRVKLTSWSIAVILNKEMRLIKPYVGGEAGLTTIWAKETGGSSNRIYQADQSVSFVGAILGCSRKVLPKMVNIYLEAHTRLTSEKPRKTDAYYSTPTLDDFTFLTFGVCYR